MESLSSLSKYKSSTLAIIESEIVKARKLESEILNTDPEFHDEYNAEFHEIRIILGMKDIYDDSLIFTYYSFLERTMQYACKYLSERQKLKLKDISGSGLEKYRKYITKVCEIDLSKNNSAWEILRNYNQLRNYLIHSENNRILSNEDRKHKIILQFLRKFDLAEIKECNSSNNISFNIKSNKLINLFSETIHDFLYDIYYIDLTSPK